MKTTIALFGLLFSTGTIVVAQNPDSVPKVNINDTVPQKFSLDTNTNRWNTDTSTGNWNQQAAPKANDTAQQKKPETEEKLSDRAMMKNGEMMIIKNGEETKMQDEVVFPSGTVVKTDGTVRKKDGSEVKLKDGQYIALPSPEADKKKPEKKVPLEKSGNKNPGE